VIGRVHPDEDPGRSLLVFRRRTIDASLRETVVLRNAGSQPLRCILDLHVGADFAGLFEVKEDRVETDGRGRVEIPDDQRVVISAGDGEHRCRLRFGQPCRFDGTTARFTAEVPAKGDWALDVVVIPCTGDDVAADQEGLDTDEGIAARTAEQWRAQAPVLIGDDRLVHSFDCSVADLGALRIFDPRYGGHPVLAAGAPWFMTLFGRDSLLASWMALIVDPTLALHTLEVLADLQGEKVDDRTEEEPGRILHEVRFGRSSLVAPGAGAGTIYYGTADATPLFAALVGEVARWGADHEAIARLLPAVDRALEWSEQWGDRDGDGYVEYQRTTEAGLHNQGWKDSWDGVSFADGRLAEPPIALCEVQAYVYAAFRARAALAALFGDEASVQRWLSRADEFRRRFNEDFWLEDRGWYAVALDRHKRPVDGLTSNMGHALWCGIADDEKAAAVAARLTSGDLFTGWGVRTLARSMARYDPLSYHNGSVWPHDTVIAAAGLTRYGFIGDAHRLLDGLLDAARHYDRHLPELFSGLDRDEAPVPVDYPTSSAPQAWAAAAPLLAVRTLLGLEPDVPDGCLHVAPALLPTMRRLRLERLPLGDGTRITVEVDGDDVSVTGLPDGLAVVGESAAVRRP
jgi:glycogen debranching enzyme